jgi:hypothetical protein
MSSAKVSISHWTREGVMEWLSPPAEHAGGSADVLPAA